MVPTVNVVVTCSASKTRAPSRELTLRTLTSTGTDKRLENWMARLASSRASHGEFGAVEALYKGQHWASVCLFRKLASQQGITARIWITSAGLGLIPWGAMVPPYAATFAGSEDDSVSLRPDAPTRRAENMNWWSKLSFEDPLSFGEPRSIAGLAASHPRTPLVLAVSANYLEALEGDVVAAARVLHGTDLLSIISVGCLAHSSAIKDWLLPADARLQQLVGGSLGALNARILGLIISGASEAGWGRMALRRFLEEVLKPLEPRKHPSRIRPTEGEIRDYIHSAIVTDPSVTHSGLLRSFRDEGYACEQSRFRDLFKAARVHNNAN